MEGTLPGGVIRNGVGRQEATFVSPRSILTTPRKGQEKSLSFSLKAPVRYSQLCEPCLPAFYF